jgi:hypothetical protein
MNVFEQVKHPVASILSSPLAMVLIISTLLWATGAPLLMHRADAAQVTNISDTLYDSDLGVGTKHTIRYTTASSTPAGGVIQFIFDPAGSNFSVTGTAATTTNITATGMTIVTSCGGLTDEVVPTVNQGAGVEGYSFTVCAGDTVTSGAKTITIGVSTSSPLITNPAAAGSYRITMTNSGNSDYGEARVAIIDDVVVTASVDTTFTFSISGMATSTVVNGETVNGTASSTYIAFGTLSVGAPQVRAQRLNVVTNAAFGYSVTVVEDQNLTSSTGADIDVFKDGASSTPTAWTSPTNTLGSENTYGHLGVTSDDAVLSAGDYFGTQLFSGEFGTPLQVMYHNAPSDGVTAGVGSTTVAYKVEIGSLQEAGADYTNTLTYVATPIF